MFRENRSNLRKENATEAEKREKDPVLTFDGEDLVAKLEQTPDYSVLGLEDVTSIQREIFHAWYENQGESVLDAVGRVRSENSLDAFDSLKNLLADSYLFAKRAEIRKQSRREPALKKYDSKEARAFFSLVDVRFQQEAAIFLLSCQNDEVRNLFLDDLQENLESVQKSKKEKGSGTRGIMSFAIAMKFLLDDEHRVVIPSAEVDAREKIDLVSEKDSKLYLVQVKTKSNPEEKRVRVMNVGEEGLISVDDPKNDFEIAKMKTFQESLQYYKSEWGKDIEAVVIVSPRMTREEFFVYMDN